jgi:outer membrane protein assembly factor BamA
VTLLAAVALAACPAQVPKALDPDGGLPSFSVAQVCVVGADDELKPLLTTLVSTGVDAGFSAEQVRTDLEYLVTTGMVRDARAIALPAERTVVYAVEQYPRLLGVRPSGSALIDASSMFIVGVPLSPTTLRTVCGQLKERYAGLGYPNTEVTASLESADGGVSLALNVQPGTRLNVAAIRFTGNKRTPVAELRAAVKTQVGGAFMRDAVDADALALTSVLFNRGLLEGKATVPDPKERNGKPGQVDVVFEVTEGELYKVGQVAVGGWTFGPVPLKLLESQKGKPFSRPGADRDVDRLKHQAAERGVEVDVMLLTALDAKAHTVGVSFEVAKRTPASIKF